MATTPNDLSMTEWAECRTTIGRMDSALEDLRKYGFSLVTGLLTAGSLVGGATTGENAAALVPAAAGVVVVLVLGLFAIDMYYQVVLGGAVERALDIEAATNPAVRLTALVSRSAHRSWSVFAIPLVYGVFVATAAAMAWFVKGAHNSSIVWLAAGVAAMMLLYWGLAVYGFGHLRTFKGRQWIAGSPGAPLGP